MTTACYAEFSAIKWYRKRYWRRRVRHSRENKVFYFAYFLAYVNVFLLLCFLLSPLEFFHFSLIRYTIRSSEPNNEEIMNQTQFDPQKKPMVDIPPPMVDDLDKASRRKVGVTGRAELVEQEMHRMTMIKESQRKRAMTTADIAIDSMPATEATDEKDS
jgi:hypothetical protein